MNTPFYLSALGMINALGNNKVEIYLRLTMGNCSGMIQEKDWISEITCYVGKVKGDLPTISPYLAHYACRNNQLLLAAFQQIESAFTQAISLYGRSRIGVVIGTSTSGIAEGEQAIAQLEKTGSFPKEYIYTQQEISNPALFLAEYLEITGPAYTLSTACTSSGKAFASAKNLLDLNLCDAVIVGGVDSLCRLTLNGFTALESVSPEICNPMSRNRCGINIGEGAAVFLMTREKHNASIMLLGIGESSDAYHISAPDPEGKGAEIAIRSALQDAQISAGEIGYVNLHGTATQKNDEMESKVMARVFPNGVICSSTKPLTGHLLGAAAATELGFCWLALSKYNTAQTLPPHHWDGQQDPALPSLNLATHDSKLPAKKRHVLMSNSFAFGGNNVSLIVSNVERVIEEI